MTEKDSHNQETLRVSRRRFLQGFGSGLLGSAILSRGGLVGAERAQASSSPERLGPGPIPLRLNVNGQTRTLTVAPHTTLLEALRGPELHLTGAKRGCNHGTCGACTVLLDDKPVYACMMLAVDAQGKKITTVEGLATGGKPTVVQEAFVARDAMQCGFCTPGFVVSATALLNRNPRPDDHEIRRALAGHVCRCGAYQHIFDAVREAARRRNGGR